MEFNNRLTLQWCYGNLTAKGARIDYLHLTSPIAFSKLFVAHAQGGFIPGVSAISYDVQYVNGSFKIQFYALDNSSPKGTANRCYLFLITI